MFDILTVVPGKKKLTSSGWYSFNAICCSHRGHRADRRGRGGIKFDGDINWSMHCFNCGFKCSFKLGKSLSKNTKLFLSYCGVEETQIQKYNLESLQHKDLIEYVHVKKEKLNIKFKDHKLPMGELIDTDNELHKVYVDYLQARKINPNSYPFMITPNEKGRMANRIIIPYTYKNKIVGHTSRFLDTKIPKYINEQQPGYVFGYDLQRPEWEFCILVEGIFDALSINGLALTHNSISDEQATLISSLRKRVIFVPDRDESGIETCERALDLGYSVSIPNWNSQVKDVNDAVVKYGKFATLLSIIQSATTSKIKVEMLKKKIEKVRKKIGE